MDVGIRFRRLSLLAVASLAALTTACGAATDSSTRGDPAVWFLGLDQELQESTTTFTALVSRLGCNDGVTGQVLEPEIRMSESEVVVTFSVAPKQPGPATCPDNDEVSYEVDLGEPLGARALVDGQCLPGGEAATTSFCRPGATRFRP
jgi:hypothetical protein